MSPADDSDRAAGRHPAAVVWDLDGTLVDSAPDLATTLNLMLSRRGLPEHGIDAVRLMIGHGVPKLLERGFRAAGAPLSNEEIDALTPGFLAHYATCATDRSRTMPGAIEALKHFQSAGIPQGLCTNKNEKVSRQILAALGLAGFLDSVIGGDSTAERKPHPLPVRTCFEQLGMDPGMSLLIGDSAADVGAARAAGVGEVAVVADGYTDRPAEQLGADRVLDTLERIAEYYPAP